MASSAALQPEPAPIVACTISRDVQNFDLLIEDMEAELGEKWGDLSFEDAAVFLKQEDAASLDFLAIAVDDQDEEHLPAIGQLITDAKSHGIRVILIAEEVSPVALHELLRLGADDFVPYPLPEGALHDAIARLNAAPAVATAAAPTEDESPEMVSAPKAGAGGHNGVVIATHGLSGGVGCTNFAVNLAWELATVAKKDNPRVCLLDFDLQFGAIATYLDLPRREAVFELLSDTASMDADSFHQALLTYNDKLHVLTSPADMLPLDLITGEDVDAIIAMARNHFDFVIVDMPKTLVQWFETVLNQCDVYFALLELDMRSAQNTLRMIRALKAEDLPHEKLRFILNRAPKFTDLSGKSRVKRLAENLDIEIEVQLPDGGRPVTQANDHGMPLAESAAKSPLRKEIQKLAKSVHEHALASVVNE